MSVLYRYADLQRFATDLAVASRMPAERARVQADVLLEADLMGHSTHGLNLLPGFLSEAASGVIDVAAEPDIVSDRGAVAVWDGRRAPGTWLMSRAVEEALSRTSQHPVVTYVIRRSGHIGALVPYLRRIAQAGRVVLMMTTNPMMRTVAPPGGIEALIAPNPIGLGVPTQSDPILIDISTSTVANGWVRRWAKEGKRLPERWIQDAQGIATDDPAALFGTPRGSLMPLGGSSLGYKGFALGLIVELLTGGLSGVGHTGDAVDVGNLVYLQVTDPEAFSGRSDFERDASALADACRASRVPPGRPHVRMPGDRALAERARQLADGIELYPTIMQDLEPWAKKLGVSVPTPMASP